MNARFKMVVVSIHAETHRGASSVNVQLEKDCTAMAGHAYVSYFVFQTGWSMLTHLGSDGTGLQKILKQHEEVFMLA